LIELIPILLFLILSLASPLVEKTVRERVAKLWGEKLITDAASLVFISLALFGAGWGVSNLYEGWKAEAVKSLTIFVSSLYLVKVLYLLGGGREKRLPYLFFSLALLLKLATLYPEVSALSPHLLKLLKAFTKVFIWLGAVSVIWELPLQRLFKLTAVLTLSFLFLLWLFGYLQFTFKSLIGVAILAFLSVAYTIVVSKLLPKLSRKLLSGLTERDIEVVEKNVKYLLTVLYLFISIRILEAFSNFSKLIEFINGIYLIKTELVKISIGNIVAFALTAVLLFSFLGIAKKLIKLSFPKERREVEGGSAEALIFNLGVLFNSIVLLSTLGITWKVILPIAGTLGVGLGFGLQTIMNNYVSGFILLFSKKLKVGDIVELPSISLSTLGSSQPSVFGKVEDIGILSTIVRTNDGVEISIPNSNFISSPIVNFSLKDSFVRLKIPVGVSYSSDPLTVKKLLEEVIDELPYAVKGLPRAVRFEELGDSALIFRAIFWIDIRRDLWVRNVVSDFYYKAWYKLKEAGIEIPFPQNDIWFRNTLKVEIEKGKEEA